jgi:hypothetical protein
MSERDERSFGKLGGPDALAPMIDFRGADGTCYALAYSELLSVALTSPGCIVMEFRKHKVVVRGRNLTAVYRGLVGQTVAYLQEDDFDLAPESEVFIDSLAIEPRAE